MTIAAKLLLTFLTLFIFIVIAVLVEPNRRSYPGWLQVILGLMVICVVVGVPASAIAWIWGW